MLVSYPAVASSGYDKRWQLRVPNYFFVALRLGFALVMTGLYLAVVIFAPAHDPADKSGFDKRIFAVLTPFVLIPFIIAALRAIVRVNLEGGLTVRRLIGTDGLSGLTLLTSPSRRPEPA